MIEATSKISFN